MIAPMGGMRCAYSYCTQCAAAMTDHRLYDPKATLARIGKR
jgi:hypothetical protein